MNPNEQNADTHPAAGDSSGKGRFWHWVRIGVSLLSFGLIFPHAMTEDMEDAKPGGGQDR